MREYGFRNAAHVIDHLLDVLDRAKKILMEVDDETVSSIPVLGDCGLAGGMTCKKKAEDAVEAAVEAEAEAEAFRQKLRLGDTNPRKRIGIAAWCPKCSKDSVMDTYRDGKCLYFDCILCHTVYRQIFIECGDDLLNGR